MEKELSDSDVSNSTSFKEPENDKSFVGKFKSHVSDIISNTPLSKWFRKQTESGSTIRRRDEDCDDEELYQLQPPTKRTRLPDQQLNNCSINFSETLSPINNVHSVSRNPYNSFPEPVAGPSGCNSRKLLSSASTISVNSVNKFRSSELLNCKDSDSEESTSGYSSVARIGSKEQVCGSQESSKQTSPLENSPAKARTLFQTPTLPTGRSLFAERSLSPNMNCSLSSRRPSFNASTFGSPNFVDRTLSTKRIINSPFYSGRTTYGGASAYGRNLGRSSQDLKSNLRNSVQIKPVNKSKTDNGNMQLGKTARRILDTLERYSTPVSDVKKIPVPSKKTRQEGVLSKYAGANPYVLREPKVASNKELQVPSVPDLLKMKLEQQKSRLQESTEAVRQIATKASLNDDTYKIETEAKEKDKHTSKMKTKISSVRQKPQVDEPVSELKLNPVALPIKNLPKFDLIVPPAPAIKTADIQKETTAKVVDKSNVNKPQEFKFSSPVVIAENKKSIIPINNFKFSEPLSKSQTLNFKMPENKVPSVVKAKYNGETVAKSLPLKTGSVMDILGKNNKDSDSNISSSTTLMDKFKPAEGTWECSVCMVRNQPDKKKCVACETINPKAKPASKESPKVETDSLASFGDKFKATGDTWECSVCMIRNKNEVAKCAACESPKPGATENKAVLKPFGTSTTAVPLTTNFGSKFAPPPSTWECGVCMIRNKNELNKCAACETARPGSSQPVSSFGSEFKAKEDEWECGVCMVRNKSSTAKCQCCETARPGTKSASIPSISTEKKPLNSFNFGVDKATAMSFTFGVPANAQTPANPLVNNSVPSIFGASTSTAGTPGTFTFGIPSSTSTQEKPKSDATTPAKVETTMTKPLSDNPLLKSNEQLPEKAKIAPVGFTFGVQNTSTANDKSSKKTATSEDNADSSPAKKSKPVDTSSSSEASKATFVFKPLAANGEINKPQTSLFGNGAKTEMNSSSATPSLFGSRPKDSPNKSTFTIGSGDVKKDATGNTAPENKLSFNAPSVGTSSAGLFSFGAKSAASAVSPVAVKPVSLQNQPSQGDTPKQPVFQFGSGSTGSSLPKFGASAAAPFTTPIKNNFSSATTLPFNSSATLPTFNAPTSSVEQTNKPATFTFGQAAPSASSASNTGFNFGSTPSSGFKLPAVDAKPVFGAAVAPTDSTKGNIFAPAPTQSNGMFNFGSGAASSTNQKAGFSFGSANSGASPAQGGFNFGAASASTPQSGGFNFSAAAPPAFDASVKPTFNFTGGNVTGFAAQPTADGGSANPRKIKRAVRRTHPR